MIEPDSAFLTIKFSARAHLVPRGMLKGQKMGESNSRLAEEVAKLDAEIRELEKQIGESEADIVSRVIFRVNDIIDEEIRQVDGN
jgi:hypothetical protein